MTNKQERVTLPDDARLESLRYQLKALEETCTRTCPELDWEDLDTSVMMHSACNMLRNETAFLAHNKRSAVPLWRRTDSSSREKAEKNGGSAAMRGSKGHVHAHGGAVKFSADEVLIDTGGAHCDDNGERIPTDEMDREGAHPAQTQHDGHAIAMATDPELLTLFRDAQRCGAIVQTSAPHYSANVFFDQSAKNSSRFAQEHAPSHDIIEIGIAGDFLRDTTSVTQQGHIAHCGINKYAELARCSARDRIAQAREARRKLDDAKFGDCKSARKLRPQREPPTLTQSLSIPLELAAPATDEPQQLSPREFVRQVSRKLELYIEAVYHQTRHKVGPTFAINAIKVLTRHTVDLFEVEQEYRRRGAMLCLAHPMSCSIRMAPKSLQGGGGREGDSTFSIGVAVLNLSPAFHGTLCAVLMVFVTVVFLFMGHQLTVFYTNMQL